MVLIDDNIEVMEMTDITISNGTLDVKKLLDTMTSQTGASFELIEHNGNAIRNLLLVRRFVNNLNNFDLLKVTNLDYIDTVINNIDHTVLNLN
jgi:hypothetical protein